MDPGPADHQVDVDERLSRGVKDGVKLSRRTLPLSLFLSLFLSFFLSDEDDSRQTSQTLGALRSWAASLQRRPEKTLAHINNEEGPV